MIIWGSKVREITQSSGTFHCPECANESEYTEITAKKYFTLYFIPLFPLETLETYIKCKGCNQYYKPAVLQYRPPTVEEQIISYAHDELASGTPVNMVKQKLLNHGLEESSASSLLESILGENTKVCLSCNLEYFSEISVCSNCGKTI